MKHLPLALVVGLAGCWDKVTYTNDCIEHADSSGTTDTDGDTDSDSDADADSGDDDGGPAGQGDTPPGWEGFGAPCEVDEDCTGYPAAEKRCITDVLGIINTPGGYCTACCDAEEIDGCADNIDCVGANNAFVICLVHCDSDEDCRQDEDYICRSIYYISAAFPGDYCMPTPEYVDTDIGDVGEDAICPWPWL